MASVDVHVNAYGGELRESVVDTGEVCGLGIGALLHAQVGN